MAEPKWARGSNQYVKRSRPTAAGADREAKIGLSRSSSELRELACGIRWDSAAIEFEKLKQHGVDSARNRLRHVLPNFIWDAAALEGNTYTLPEVQTLLEGTTVGGRPVEDAAQILALRDAFADLDHLVVNSIFALNKLTSDRLHSIVAEHEAIESGHFRGEGDVGGGGLVSLGALGLYRASTPGEGGQTLLDEHRTLMDYLTEVDDPREQAIAYFCAAARRQFYFDGNKRTARLMMSGHLLTHGYDAISINATRRIEFNEHLSHLFDTGDATGLMAFILDNRTKDAE